MGVRSSGMSSCKKFATGAGHERPREAVVESVFEIDAGNWVAESESGSE